jgi:hypothetical protein
MCPERLTSLRNNLSQINPGKTLSPLCCFQGFFREVATIFRPPSVATSYCDRHAGLRTAGTGLPERALMYDLAAIAIALACFVFVFILIEIFDRV